MYSPRMTNREQPKSLQRMLTLVGHDISVILTNGKTINGILDSFCLKPAIAYLILETIESIEVFNFNNVISLRCFKEQPET